ncbi:MAG: hypothetical protein WBZ01_17300, partial [Terriglobales bacterium]
SHPIIIIEGSFLPSVFVLKQRLHGFESSLHSYPISPSSAWAGTPLSIHHKRPAITITDIEPPVGDNGVDLFRPDDPKVVFDPAVGEPIRIEELFQAENCKSVGHVLLALSLQ